MAKFHVVIDEVVTYRFEIDAFDEAAARRWALDRYHHDSASKAAALVSVTNVEVVDVEAQS